MSNPKAPKLVMNVETCKSSHTHTLVPHPTNKNIVYLYVSGQQAVRPETELAGCKNGTDPRDPTNSLYQLDIIKVFLDAPEKSVVIPGARIFADLGAPGECARYGAPVDPRHAARVGVPGDKLDGLSETVESPQFATVTGLALYGAHRTALGGVIARRPSLSGAGVDKLATRVKTWLQDFF